MSGNLQGKEKTVSWMHFATAESVMTQYTVKFKLEQLSSCYHNYAECGC